MSTIFEPSHQLQPLGELRVIDAMHPGMISCPPETSLRTVARMMATYRVHAIIVLANDSDGLDGGTLWGVVSDADLMLAAQADDFELQTARSLAATAPLTIEADASLESAVRLMVEHEVTHLIVVERHSRRPIGVVSTLDIAGALAGYVAQAPGTTTSRP